MKKSRLSLVLLLLALVAIFVPAALAQDTDTLGASQAVYDEWVAANTTSGAFKTVTYAFTATLNVTGLDAEAGDMTANLAGSGVIDANEASPAFQLDVTGSIVQGKDTTPVNLGVRLVDDFLYYNDGSGWKGQKAEDAMQSFGEGFAQGSGLPINPSDLSSGDLSSLGGMEGMGDAMAALSALKPSDFLKLSSAEEDGQTHFTLSLSIADLLGSPALAPLFSSALGGAGNQTGDAANSQMTDAQMQQMQAMMGMMFSEATVTLDQYADPSTHLVSRAVLDISLPLDNIMGPGAAVALNFDINLSNYDEAVTVETPADVQMTETSAS